MENIFLGFQDRGPPNTLYYIVRRVVKVVEGYSYTLPDIGLAIEKLTGYACKSAYTTDEFRAKYTAQKRKRKVYLIWRTSNAFFIILTLNRIVAAKITISHSHARSIGDRPRSRFGKL